LLASRACYFARSFGKTRRGQTTSDKREGLISLAIGLARAECLDMALKARGCSL
jgi:hypothetical protein